MRPLSVKSGEWEGENDLEGIQTFRRCHYVKLVRDGRLFNIIYRGPSSFLMSGSLVWYPDPFYS